MEGPKTLCPVCSSEDFEDISSSLHRCRNCSAGFNSGYKPLLYNNNYFIDEYREQYGKTYLDDYDHIYSMSMERLKRIVPLVSKQKDLKNASLLDIGSAMGFFLKAAMDSGLGQLKGIEISEYAGGYCRDEFGIDVITSSFDDIEDPGMFDIITAWFFIEHCEDPGDVIGRIFSSLNQGGVLAFSSPSISGPLFRFNREEWIKTHPGDHRIDLSPASARTLLKKIGFKKVHIRAAGIHPERIVPRESILFRPFSFLYKIFSRLTAFSDTIEVYAVK